MSELAAPLHSGTGEVCSLALHVRAAEGFTLRDEPPMTSRRRLGDRRHRVRYEIVGQLWGSLETFEPLELHNVSRGGILAETRVPMTTDTVQRLRLASSSETTDVTARVAHVEQRQDVMAPETFLIGMQFLELPKSVADYVDGRAGEAQEREIPSTARSASEREA